ncbi:hypothetical protein [Comamonas aquatilis]|uniref:hypothetical protein n=1 Tax=Comamonas aquatilis TaxID=1778406 RepID=UPI0039EE0DCD
MPAIRKAAPFPTSKSAKETKLKKPKLVRDSFTCPMDEYASIEELKLRAAQQGRVVKKSELLRAGLMLLTGLEGEQLLAALQAVPSIKTGRPAKSEEVPESVPATEAAQVSPEPEPAPAPETAKPRAKTPAKAPAPETAKVPAKSRAKAAAKAPAQRASKSKKKDKTA